MTYFQAYLLIIALYGGLALLFIVIGASLSHSWSKARKRCSMVVDAKIINYEQRIGISSKGRRQVAYLPIYEFEMDGQFYRITASIGNYEKKYDIGQTIELHINPTDYTDVYDYNMPRGWMAPALYLLAAFLIAMGIWSIIAIS